MSRINSLKAGRSVFLPEKPLSMFLRLLIQCKTAVFAFRPLGDWQKPLNIRGI